MAQKTLIQLVDDLDGSEITDGEGRTVALAFDGATYELDLSGAHIDELAALLKPYFSAGRKTKRKSNNGRQSGTKSSPDELQAIRDWARKNGHTVSGRGRIAKTIRDAYDAANSGPANR